MIHELESISSDRNLQKRMIQRFKGDKFECDQRNPRSTGEKGEEGDGERVGSERLVTELQLRRGHTRRQTKTYVYYFLPVIPSRFMFVL